MYLVIISIEILTLYVDKMIEVFILPFLTYDWQNDYNISPFWYSKPFTLEKLDYICEWEIFTYNYN